MEAKGKLLRLIKPPDAPRYFLETTMLGKKTTFELKKVDERELANEPGVFEWSDEFGMDIREH